MTQVLYNPDAEPEKRPFVITTKKNLHGHAVNNGARFLNGTARTYTYIYTLQQQGTPTPLQLNSRAALFHPFVF